jgi:hypothetical protein
MSAPKLLGKRPPRFDARVPQLERHLARAALPPPPARKDWPGVSKVAAWGAMLNDRLGDCVIAAKGHAVLLWTALTGTHRQVVLPDSVVLAGYEAVGGYVPGNPATDNGCDMLTAAQYFQSTGFGGHRVSAFATLHAGKAMNVSHWQEAINLFGLVDVGLTLPAAWREKASAGDVWDVGPGGKLTGDWAPGSWGGHDVPLMGYDGVAKVYKLITWGQEQYVTERALRAYSDEAYTYLSPDWVYNGTAPNLYKLSDLQADLQLESARALPRFNWPAFKAWAAQMLRTFGPAAVPLIEQAVATLPLTPAEVAAIDALVQVLLGGGTKARLVSETTRGF